MSRNVGWDESKDVEVEDGVGLDVSVKEWKGYVEGSSSAQY